MFFCPKCNFKYDITKNIDTGKPSREDPIKNTSAYFICNNCGFNEEIMEGTVIYSDNINKPRLLKSMNKDVIYDHTLPITKKYVCTNSECQTHKDPTKKKAVFFKKNHKVTYVCKVCEALWDI